jgi:enoyl-[acyl-carrier-protein] reductase (NADH)
MAAAVLAIPEMRQMLYKEIPLGRGVQPAQIASEALNLVRPDSAVTGQSIMVDNGLSLRRPPFPEEIPASVFQEGAKRAGY